MTFAADADLIEQIVRHVDPSFASVPPEAIDDHVAALHKAATAELDTFLIAGLRLTALAGNAHSRLIVNAAIRVLPVRIVGAGAGWRAIAMGEAGWGRPLRRIADLPVEEAVRRLAPLLPAPDARRRALSGHLLAWPAALREIGADFGDTVVFEREGDTLRLPPGETVPGSEVYPLPEQGFPVPRRDPWPDLARGVRATYLRLETLDAGVEPDVAAWAAEAVAAVRAAPGRDAILDLRGNAGGSFFHAMPLVDALARDWTGARCDILVDRFTFSAGIVAAVLVMHGIGPRARLVGEPVGDVLAFWAEGGTQTLPLSGALFRWSDGWHDWATGRAGATTPPEIAAAMVGVGRLDPIAPGAAGPEMVSLFEPWLAPDRR